MAAAPARDLERDVVSVADGRQGVEDEPHCARDDAAALAAAGHRARGRRGAHAVRLAGAGLPVREDLRARQGA